MRAFHIVDSHGNLSPRMNAELGERRILLGERDAFSLRGGVFPVSAQCQCG